MAKNKASNQSRSSRPKGTGTDRRGYGGAMGGGYGGAMGGAKGGGIKGEDPSKGGKPGR
jgi:hypothetical protein